MKIELIMGSSLSIFMVFREDKFMDKELEVI